MEVLFALPPHLAHQFDRIKLVIADNRLWWLAITAVEQRNRRSIADVAILVPSIIGRPD